MPAGKLIYKDRWFIWIGVPENRHLPRAAGFRYMGAPYFYWQTQDWEKACVLVAYADDDCRTLLQQQMGFKPLNIEASRATDADIEIPAPAGLEYMGFQKAGIAFANERENTLIADEMGLGKTIQALGFINANPEIEQILIVCPASLKINWRRELERWLVGGYLIITGSGKPGLQARNGIKRLLTFDYHVGSDSAEEMQDIERARGAPNELRELTLDAGIGSEFAPVSEASDVGEEPFAQGDGRIAHGDLVPAASGNDPALTIDDAGKVGQDCWLGGDNKQGLETPPSTVTVAQQPLVMVSHGGLLQAEIGGDHGYRQALFFSLVQALKGCKEVSVRNPGWPCQGVILILNYDVLEQWKPVITSITKWGLFCADEAHYGKNANARRSKVMHGIQAKRTLYLTGTPICNRPKELWPLIQRLDPERWPDRAWAEYRDKYCYANPETPSGARALANLQQILRSSVMVRRLKKDVLKDLPPKRRQVIELPATGESAAAVRAEQAAVQQFTAQMVELKANVELMKASEDPAEYIAAVKALREGAGAWFGAISKLRHDTAVAKLPQVKVEIDAALDTGEKVVVFAHHHDVIDSIMGSFGGAVKLDGTMAQPARQASVDAFQNDPATRLFVGSIQAAGVGLTLTASRLVIFAELDWVPGNMTQAEDRTHRIGQVNSVLIQHLVLEESLDATMAKTLVNKQLVIDAALDNEAGAELAEQPLVPLEGEHALEGVTRHQVEREAEILSPQEVNAVHEALRILAANCDGARTRDGAGFNMVDAAIGRKLAEHGWLSRKQAALGRRIVRKYHGQIPADLMEIIGQAPESRRKAAAELEPAGV